MSQPPSESPSTEVLRDGHTTYELIRRLGLGSNGEWVLARRRYHAGFGGFTLLKCPQPPLSEKTRRRLVEEGLVSSQLNHPNLPVTQLLGPPQLPHLAVEHVPGFRLEALLRHTLRTHMSLSESMGCHVVAEVAEALHHAHMLLDEHGRALGLVHRDVTPSNILVGEHGEVKLMDFGAAFSRLEGRLATTDSELQGSLAYAAPEYVQQLPLDGRADQFSLGIVLLQVLTGRHLFEGAERLDAQRRQRHVTHSAATQQCARELKARIRAYSNRDLEEATRTVPELLRPVVHRMLAPDRSARFASCAQLARVLREHLMDSGQPWGRYHVLTELMGLKYLALRVVSGVAPSELGQERMLPETPGHDSPPEVQASRRPWRPRAPRRR